MKRLTKIPFIIILLLFPFYVHADELSAIQETVARQQEQIDFLSQKIKDHENEDSSKFGWNLGLFGDINYTTKSREHPHDAFYFHELSLYSAASYGDRLNFLAEIAFEHEEADIERVWIGYTVNDLLVIRAGKFHTAMGYWNKTYHHGRQLFTTVDRPFFLAFEHDGGVLPVHITGLEIEGSKAFGIGRLKYEFELGNGPEMMGGMLEPNNASDNNSSKQPVLRVSLRPSAVKGLSVGVFATNFEVDTSTKTGLDETIYGADIVYAANGFEFITEGFIFYNPDGDGIACYGQLSYTYGDWTPYARYERLEVQGTDPYFKDLPGGFDRRQTIAGLKYDIDPIRSSLKFQYRHDDATKDYDVFETQWSFHF
ncbi:MAG: hypothetical protein Q7T53_02940 [Deltaproteobacteria bacterium]|nr:hypothetical protein [Deltaproteobacteria bacterium]